MVAGVNVDKTERGARKQESAHLRIKVTMIGDLSVVIYICNLIAVRICAVDRVSALSFLNDPVLEKHFGNNMYRIVIKEL